MSSSLDPIVDNRITLTYRLLNVEAIAGFQANNLVKVWIQYLFRIHFFGQFNLIKTLFFIGTMLKKPEMKRLLALNLDVTQT